MRLVADALEANGSALITDAVCESILNSLDGVFDVVDNGAGARLFELPASLSALLWNGGALHEIASGLVGQTARPVRVLLFDKSESTNWQVAWHQDRTIAVAQRGDVPGFENWTTKDGVLHVEPPYSIMERLLTLRLHFDDCGPDNGPLLTMAGSHRMGKLPQTAITQLAKTGAPQIHTANRGDVLALRTTIIHASARATRPTRRRVLHVEYSPDDTPKSLGWALPVTP